MFSQTLIAISAVASILTVLITGLIAIRKMGKVEGQQQGWRLAVDETLKRHAQHHDQHFQHEKDDQVHFQDTEMHWTSTERVQLYKRLDRQDEKQDEILKEIRQLGERMYGQ